MKQVRISDAKARLSEIVREAVAGVSTILTRNGEPVAKIVPMPLARIREFGFDDGLGRIADDFDDPLPADILAKYFNIKMSRADWRDSLSRLGMLSL